MKNSLRLLIGVGLSGQLNALGLTLSDYGIQGYKGIVFRRAITVNKVPHPITGGVVELRAETYDGEPIDFAGSTPPLRWESAKYRIEVGFESPVELPSPEVGFIHETDVENPAWKGYHTLEISDLLHVDGFVKAYIER